MSRVWCWAVPLPRSLSSSIQSVDRTLDRLPYLAGRAKSVDWYSRSNSAYLGMEQPLAASGAPCPHTFWFPSLCTKYYIILTNYMELASDMDLFGPWYDPWLSPAVVYYRSCFEPTARDMAIERDNTIESPREPILLVLNRATRRSYVWMQAKSCCLIDERPLTRYDEITGPAYLRCVMCEQEKERESLRVKSNRDPVVSKRAKVMTRGTCV